MRSDFFPIEVRVKSGSDIKIYPVADLHYGSPQFKEKEWEKFKEKILSEENAYIVLVGDMMNNALKTSLSNVYEETCSPHEQKEWLIEQLTPLKDKILCGVGGNHERRSIKDVDLDPLYDVFARLEIADKYRQGMAVLIITLCLKEERGHVSMGKRPTYVVACTHGAGSGIKKSSDFGMSMDGIDILITGHTHKPMVVPTAKLVVNSNKKTVTTKQFYLVTASSWLDYGGYAIQKLYTPTAHTQTEITLHHDKNAISITQ